MDHPKTVFQSATRFFFGTMLSRLSGLVRENALAYWFGATPTMAAFFVAYRFSQLLRRLLGESSLLTSFSPYFEAIRSRSEVEAKEWFRSICTLLSTVLFGVVIALEAILLSWWKWGNLSPDTAQIVLLTMMMLPGVIFLCLYALFCALLQSNKKYFLPSMAPLWFNLTFLLTLWWVKDLPQNRATLLLAVGISFACLIQWVVLLPPSIPFLKGAPRPKAPLLTPQIRQMISSMMWTMIGVGAVQINGCIDALLARYATPTGPAYLYYALRLYQLPIALFGLSLASALLPPLARAFQRKEESHYKALLHNSFQRSFGFIFPITIALFVMGDSVVNLVYGRGAFDTHTVVEVTHCLWGYTIGLLPSIWVLLLAPAFHAQKDFKTPLYGSLYSITTNLIGNLVMIFGLGWGSTSIAIATGLSAFVNAFYLTWKLSGRIGPIFDRGTLLSFMKVMGCAVSAGALTTFTGKYLLNAPGITLLFSHTTLFPQSFTQQLLRFAFLGGVFTTLLYLHAIVLRIPTELPFLNQWEPKDT